MPDLIERLMPEVPAPASWLGLAGVLPFLAGAVALYVAPDSGLLRSLMLGYGVAILSFMGGCLWGFAAAGMGGGASLRDYALSVLPCLYAWIVVELPGAMPFFALALGFVALLIADLRLAAEGRVPQWWPALRRPLTLGACTGLVLAGVA